jgi:hypothetical protein
MSHLRVWCQHARIISQPSFFIPKHMIQWPEPGLQLSSTGWCTSSGTLLLPAGCGPQSDAVHAKVQAVVQLLLREQKAHVQRMVEAHAPAQTGALGWAVTEHREPSH